MAWFGVHPVADLGLAERPPVPRPEVAKSPDYDTGNDSSGTSGPGGPNSERPTIEGEATGDPETSRSSSWTGSPGSPKPPTSSTTPTVPASPTAGPTGPPPDTIYREAATSGGTATFEYVEGSDVYVVEADPKPGWDVGAYRYYRDWVVVEFVSSTHRSEAHAYIDGGKAVIEVVEDDTP
ncbi:MAG: hypothetical protein ACRDTU_22570 [Micromonosporaceae bacterium]